MGTVQAVSELMIAVGTLAGGTGVLIIGLNSKAIAEKMASEGLSEGLKGHMSAADAGRQFGKAAAEAVINFKVKQAEIEQQSYFMGNTQRSWLQYLTGM